MKKCRKCGESKNVELFGCSKRSRDGLLAECKGCVAEYHREYRKGLHSQEGLQSCSICGTDFKPIRATQVTCSNKCRWMLRHNKKCDHSNGRPVGCRASYERVTDGNPPIPAGYKRCFTCNEIQKIDAFNTRRYTSGLKPHGKCKKCLSKYQRSRQEYSRNIVGSRAGYLRRKYEMTLEEYVEIFTRQNGECAICKTGHKSILDETARRNEILYVDHCHTSNKVRELLCNNCNALIGMARESNEILFAALEYIQRHHNLDAVLPNLT